eukprot:6204355-Pleurochrysis_carterae.AAC.1
MGPRLASSRGVERRSERWQDVRLEKRETASEDRAQLRWCWASAIAEQGVQSRPELRSARSEMRWRFARAGLTCHVHGLVRPFRASTE